MHATICLDEWRSAATYTLGGAAGPDRVRRIRRQIRTGRYPTSRHLDVALERLLAKHIR